MEKLATTTATSAINRIQKSTQASASQPTMMTRLRPKEKRVISLFNQTRVEVIAGTVNHMLPHLILPSPRLFKEQNRALGFAVKCEEAKKKKCSTRTWGARG